MSWADTVKLLRESPGNLRDVSNHQTNQYLQSNTTTVTQQVNQQINQSFILRQNDTPSSTNQVPENTNIAPKDHIRQEPIVLNNNNSTVTPANKPFSIEQQIQSLSIKLQQDKEQSDQRFSGFSTLITQMIDSNNQRFQRQQLENQIHSSACMMGLQELASQLNLTISLTEDLQKKATKSILSNMSITKELQNESVVEKNYSLSLLRQQRQINLIIWINLQPSI